MNKEKLIQEAITIWNNYGCEINRVFGFKDFYIEGKPLQQNIESNSKEEIQSFINYVKQRIEELSIL
jgi:hypothetical protein